MIQSFLDRLLKMSSGAQDKEGILLMLRLCITMTLLVCSLDGMAQNISSEDPASAEYIIGGSVSRAMFTRAVVNREPVDNLARSNGDIRHIYFFTELKGFTGETITHQWLHNGKLQSEVHFEVGGPRWRVWSSKTLDPGMYGPWTVRVIDSTGREIYESEFVYTDPKNSRNSAMNHEAKRKQTL